MSNILIVYSTTDGHTGTICLKIKQVAEQNGHRVSIAAVGEPLPDLNDFDKIVVGASIRYGKHNPKIVEFIEQNRSTLDAKPNAFFSVNAVARKPEKSYPETNPYVRKFLKRIVWKPKAIAVFAGKIDYPRYRFFDRTIIRLIMRITGGPTDTAYSYEFTDWRQVESFADKISSM